MLIKEVKGNLIDLTNQGEFDIIAHGCNCFHDHGGGIAKSLLEEWPDACEVDKLTGKIGDQNRLGQFSLAKATTDIGTDLTIANLYTQYKGGRAQPAPDLDTTELRKEYLGKAFESLARHLIQTAEHLRNNTTPEPFISMKDPNGFHLGIPLIGAGIAGGNWDELKPLIISALTPVPGTLTIVHFQP